MSYDGRCIHDRPVPGTCSECQDTAQLKDLLIAEVDDLKILQATAALMSAASRLVDAFVGDRVPMTRAQTLAVLQLANATLHLEALRTPR